MNLSKIDPHQHEKVYNRWKANGRVMEGLSEENRKAICDYLDDMEIGRNISIGSRKGARGYGRLRTQKSKLHTMLQLIEEDFSISVNGYTEDIILNFFNNMRQGKYTSKRTKKVLKASGEYASSFKAFYNWYIRKNKKEGLTVPNIIVDLDTSDYKPEFNYFTIEDVKVLCDNALPKYRVLMMFLFDTGIRAPTELMNVQVLDLRWIEKGEYYELNIKDEISKTFGRKIKLLLCSDVLKSYIKENKFKSKDYIFQIASPQKINEYLSRLGYKWLKIGKASKTAKRQWIKNGISMYDFRHSSACYWLVRYKSESALKYRFGWKRSSMIHYYTNLLGMKDTIDEEDLYVDISKTELENEIKRLKDSLVIQQETSLKQLEEQKRREEFYDSKQSKLEKEVSLLKLEKKRFETEMLFDMMKEILDEKGLELRPKKHT